MKSKLVVIIFLFAGMTLLCAPQVDALMFYDLELHNPTGGNPALPEPAGVKSQFIMRNQSTAGETITSVNWLFAAGVFVDSTAAAPGIGGFRAGSVQSSDDVGFLGTILTDGDTSILFTFNGFNPGEEFEFWTDLDADATGRVGNIHFNGSSTIVTYANGTEFTYNWVLPPNNGRTFEALAQGGGGGGCEQNCEPLDAVPEPATMVLLGSGLFGGVLLRRKK